MAKLDTVRYVVSNTTEAGIVYNEKDLFEEKLNEILNLGLDGVECWYPTHTEEIRDICLRICHEKDLLITCGSDSHGDFEVEDVPMGILPVTEEDVNIGSL